MSRPATALLVAITLACSINLSCTPQSETPVTSSVFIHILKMTSATTGWAWAFEPPVTPGEVGRNLLLRTVDGGTHWRNVSLPVGSTQSFSPTEVLDQNTVWVMYLVGPGKISVLHTTDAGTHWREAIIQDSNVRSELSNTGSAQLRFVDASHGWLFVSYGHDSDEAGTLYRTVDGGQQWTVASRTDPKGSASSAIPWQGYKTGITFVDRINGWLTIPTGGPKPLLYFTHDAGTSWSAMLYPDVPGIRMGPWQYVSRPRFFSPTAGEFEVMSEHSVVYTTTDGGAKWRPAVTPVCLDFSFVDVRKGWALCHQGTFDITDLFATSDGGQNWRLVHANMEAQTKTEIAQHFRISISEPNFVNSKIGYVLRTSGSDVVALAHPASLPTAKATQSLLKTSDGGATWKEVHFIVG